MEQVNKWFGDLHVLRDVDLEVDKGEVVIVVGPSGSGKSTLCRTINRLEPIDGGTIRLEGRPLPAEGRELARLRSDVGMVFQQFNLFAHRSVLDNVTLGPIKVRGQSRQRDLAAAGMTMVVVSHEMGFARSAANRVVFMDGGRILEAAPPEEFFASPRTERARDFLSKIISH
jgi:glutamate transport system ATP-binding protein